MTYEEIMDYAKKHNLTYDSAVARIVNNKPKRKKKKTEASAKRIDIN